jgi:hypothetical protein
MGKTWKAVERRVARFFGSERTPMSGGNSKHTRSDSLHPRLYIEVKSRKKGFALLRQAWPEDVRNTKDQVIVEMEWKGEPMILTHSHSIEIEARDSSEPWVVGGFQTPKRSAEMTLFENTVKLAEPENKIPIVVLVHTGRHGFWILCREEDLDELVAIREKVQNGD